jgi:hypothetical protein
MTMRIAIWLCVLIGVSGCLAASREDPSDIASDDLNLTNDDADTKPARSPPDAEAGTTSCDPGEKPTEVKTGGESAIEACYVKAKSCYNDGNDPAECDAVLKKCSTLSDAPKPEPGTEACELQVEKCQKSGEGPEDCVAIKLDCMQGPPPKPEEPSTSLVESCWRKYKECYAYENDPELCESVAESCKKIESAELQ